MSVVLHATIASADPASRTHTDGRIIQRFTPDVVSEAIGAAGGSVLRQSTTQDGVQVIARDPLGLVLVSDLLLCEGPAGCLGLQMMYVWELDTPLPLNHLNRFNTTYPYAKASVLRDGSLMLDRYVISDKGITPGNLVENYGNFFSMPGQLFKSLGSVPQTAAETAPAY